MINTSENSPEKEVNNEVDVDERVAISESAVDWNALSAIACKQCNVETVSWETQISGGYNLVRFLHLDDRMKTIIVARVPLLPVNGLTKRYSEYLCARVESEVATMQYIESHTKIPIPHVIHHGVQNAGVHHLPYILMSKVDGSPLSSSWNDMDDEKREIVLQQVVDMLLELSTQRFDKIGALFKRQENGKDTWYLKPESVICPPEVPEGSDPAGSLYTSGTDYRIKKSKTKLEKIRENNFGSPSKAYTYTQAWFMQSLIPSLYDNSLDTKGFPLIAGDFHSQNIMVEDADTKPKIVAVLDWEFSATIPTSSFAKYPFFIVDHPLWDVDHPLKPRNVRDQETFLRLFREAECRKDDGELKLASLYENCMGVYLFEQVQSFDFLFPKLFEYIFGNGGRDGDSEDDEDEQEFSTEYNWALMEHGILKRQTQQFEFEAEVWKEAFEFLGSVIPRGLSRTEFLAVVSINKSKFETNGKVLEWILQVEENRQR
ncbi:hypothetical protein HK096_008311 [Nowakowskiella sp. JEL0078]|nr:hypothetical protein HK096_008311 [Nowakowskiella sp. JEL0078]